MEEGEPDGEKRGKLSRWGAGCVQSSTAILQCLLWCEKANVKRFCSIWPWAAVFLQHYKPQQDKSWGGGEVGRGNAGKKKG